MVTNIGSMVDELGMLQAQRTELEKRENAIKDTIRELGVGSFDGTMFRATVGEEAVRETLDVKAAKTKLIELGVSTQWLTAHTKVITAKAAVKVVARNGDKAAA